MSDMLPFGRSKRLRKRSFSKGLFPIVTPGYRDQECDEFDNTVLILADVLLGRYVPFPRTSVQVIA